MKNVDGTWVGQVNGAEQEVTVVGTYGEYPIVRVHKGPDFGKALAINWDNGTVQRVFE